MQLPTNKGLMTPGAILDQLTYNSYATQRDKGLSHEQLSIVPCWNNIEYQKRYEKLKSNDNRNERPWGQN
jgi:hypothetical protein